MHFAISMPANILMAAQKRPCKQVFLLMIKYIRIKFAHFSEKRRESLCIVNIAVRD